MVCIRKKKESLANRYHNKNNVAAFEMPSELLDKVLAYLFPTGVHVHIFPKSNVTFATRICHDPTEDEYAADIISNATTDTIHFPFAARHSNCVLSAGVNSNQDSGWYRSAMAFFETCRPLYNLTAAKAQLVARTTFIFASFDQFAHFKDVMQKYPAVRNNLTSIVVNGATIPRSVLSTSMLSHPFSLPGLENLTIFYETPSYQHPQDPSNLGIRPARTLGARLVFAAREFHGGKITNLKVCVAAKDVVYFVDGPHAVLSVEPVAFGPVAAKVEVALRAKNPA